MSCKYLLKNIVKNFVDVLDGKSEDGINLLNDDQKNKLLPVQKWHDKNSKKNMDDNFEPCTHTELVDVSYFCPDEEWYELLQSTDRIAFVIVMACDKDQVFLLEFLLRIYRNQKISYRVLFKKACVNNSLRVCKFLMNNFKDLIWKYHDEFYYANICMRTECFETFRWVVEYFNVNDTVNLKSLFDICIYTKDPRFIKYFIDNFYEDIKDEKNTGLFLFACEGGSLDVAKYLKSIEFGTDEKHNRYIFERVCENGHLDVAKWIVQEHKYLVDNYPQDFYHLFKDACDSNNIKLAEFLDDNFDIGSQDVYASILYEACKFNQLSLVKWFLNRYDFLKPDITHLLAGIRCGYEDIVNFMVSMVEVNDHFDLFIYACRHGRLNIAKWIVNNITDVNVSARNNDAFSSALHERHFHICRWLYETHHVVDDDTYKNTMSRFY